MSALECAICLAPLADGGEATTALLCAHSFHAVCLDTYCKTVNVAVADVRCPLCKRTQSDVQGTENGNNGPATPTFPLAPISWTVPSRTPRDALADELDGENTAPPENPAAMAPTLSDSVAAAGSEGSDKDGATTNVKQL